METIRVRRRVVTETVQVPVTVRREVLEVERSPVDPGRGPDGTGRSNDLAGTGDRRIEVVLREEVPVVATRVRGYERVRVDVVDVAGEVTVDTEVRREVADVDGDTGRP